jgi:ABC-type multidrug transport system permease subunit
MFVLEEPYIFFSLSFFMLPFYFLVGLQHDGALFFKYYLVAFLMASTYSSLSQLWMALAPSLVVSNVLNSFFNMMFFMFGGLFIRYNSMPSGWRWFYFIDPLPKALIAATTPQFYCDISSGSCPSIIVPGTDTPQPIYSFVTTLANGNAGEYGMYCGYLVLTIVVIRIINLIALKKISHLKR